jgi:hypothetical protein
MLSVGDYVTIFQNRGWFGEELLYLNERKLVDVSEPCHSIFHAFIGIVGNRQMPDVEVARSNLVLPVLGSIPLLGKHKLALEIVGCCQTMPAHQPHRSAWRV